MRYICDYGATLRKYEGSHCRLVKISVIVILCIYFVLIITLNNHPEANHVELVPEGGNSFI